MVIYSFKFNRNCRWDISPNQKTFFKILNSNSQLVHWVLTMMKRTCSEKNLIMCNHEICAVQFSRSVMSDSLFATPCTSACQASLSIINSWSSLKLMSIESMMPPNHLIFRCPLLFSSSIFPSVSIFPNESALCIRGPQYWSFSFNISPSSEHSGLISFRMDWLDLLVIQGTLNSLLQPYSSKHQFFSTQLSL